MRVSSLIISYRVQQFAFASEDDLQTIFDALQAGPVYEFLKNTKTVPPKELAPVLARLTGHADSYTLGVAEKLIDNRLMDPQDDIAKDMVAKFHAHAEGLFQRADFFYRVLELDMTYVQKVPHIFHPLLCGHNPAQLAEELLEIISSVHNNVQRIFFMLVFKFAVPNEKALEADKEPCLLKWKCCTKKKDPLLNVYEEAANGLWDYINYIMLNCTVRACGDKTQDADNHVKLGERWLNWLESEKRASEFVEYARNAKGRKAKHRYSVFTQFLWKYIDSMASDQTIRPLGRKRLKVSLLRVDTP